MTAFGDESVAAEGDLQFELAGSPRRKRSLISRVLTDTPVGTLLPVAGLIGLWEVASNVSLIDPVFFPAPHTIFGATWKLVGSGDVLPDLLITLERIVIGFLLGSIPAVLIGLVMGRFGIARATLEPLVNFAYTTPKIAILPLLLVIFGLGSPPIIALAAIICFFPSVVNTLYGVLQVDRRLILMARNMGASELQILRKIILPGAAPTIFAGLRLGLGAALLGTVAGEFVATSSGIGAQTWLYWQIYQVNNMYGTLIVIVLLGFVLTNGMLLIQERFFGWASATQRE